MNNRHYLLFWLTSIMLTLTACGSSQKNTQEQDKKETSSAILVPQFCADSAYAYIKEQVNFGPRVPNRDSHRECGG